MGKLKYFTRFQDKQLSDDIFISQDKYIKKLLKKFDIDRLKVGTTLMRSSM